MPPIYVDTSVVAVWLFGQKSEPTRYPATPHAIVAYLNDCQAIITYDAHFVEIAEVIDVFTPEEFMAGRLSGGKPETTSYGATLSRC